MMDLAEGRGESLYDMMSLVIACPTRKKMNVGKLAEQELQRKKEKKNALQMSCLQVVDER
jgi:hypothetical protein